MVLEPTHKILIFSHLQCHCWSMLSFPSEKTTSSMISGYLFKKTKKTLDLFIHIFWKYINYLDGIYFLENNGLAFEQFIFLLYTWKKKIHEGDVILFCLFFRKFTKRCSSILFIFLKFSRWNYQNAWWYFVYFYKPERGLLVICFLRKFTDAF